MTQRIMKKIFTSFSFFVLVFTIVSIAGDVYYRHRIVPSEPGKQRWTCRCDFRVFWTAGYRMNNYAFSGASLFDLSPKDPEYKEMLDEYLDGNRARVYDRSEAFYHFRYAPLTAFFMVPFSFIPYPIDSLILWFLLINAALFISLVLLARQTSSDFNLSKEGRFFVLWAAFAVSVKFYLMNLAVGQSDVLMALCFVLFLMAYARGREILCGFIFALILQFKPIFAPMLLYFLFTGRARLVLSAFFWSAALAFAPAVLIGPGKALALLKDWIDMLGMSVPSQLLNHKNQSLVYFIGKPFLSIAGLKSSVPVGSLFYALSAIFTVFSYAALMLFKRSLKAVPDKSFEYLEVSILLIIALLFSPIVWVANFICLIIPAAVMARLLSAGFKGWPVYAALAVFFIMGIAVGTDLTGFIPAMDEMRFASMGVGVMSLLYAIIYSYKGYAIAIKNSRAGGM